MGVYKRMCSYNSKCSFQTGVSVSGLAVVCRASLTSPVFNQSTMFFWRTWKRQERRRRRRREWRYLHREGGCNHHLLRALVFPREYRHLTVGVTLTCNEQHTVQCNNMRQPGEVSYPCQHLHIAYNTHCIVLPILLQSEGCKKILPFASLANSPSPLTTAMIDTVERINHALPLATTS